MGQGDILMSMGEARALHARTGNPVLISDRFGRSVKSDLFAGVPYILARPLPGRLPFERMLNCGGHRPYIKAKLADRWLWQAYEPKPAELVFTRAEADLGGRYSGFVLVEPNGKAIGHDNKLWSWARWVEFAVRCPYPLLQTGAPGTRRLPGATFLECGFREALAVMARSRAFVGPEGGLMHGAAAVGTPAVVLFGGFISPAVTGYQENRNLFTGTGLGCGKRTNCPHCSTALARISVDQVLAELVSLLES